MSTKPKPLDLQNIADGSRQLTERKIDGYVYSRDLRNFDEFASVFFLKLNRSGRSKYIAEASHGNTYSVVLFKQETPSINKFDSIFDAVLVSPEDYSKRILKECGLSSLVMLATKKGRKFAKDFVSELKSRMQYAES